jgi:hypothetical protein
MQTALWFVPSALPRGPFPPTTYSCVEQLSAWVDDRAARADHGPSCTSSFTMAINLGSNARGFIRAHGLIAFAQRRSAKGIGAKHRRHRFAPCTLASLGTPSKALSVDTPRPQQIDAEG